MAQDSEKRFHSIMDKLFHSPKSSPSSSSSPGLQHSRGKKRLHSASAYSSTGTFNEVQPSSGASQAPMCRPWDRADLMKRLSTFKSMKWFAKPKVVSAVNCARRGWINVDTDTIACEACGVRLLFSSPSSWSREQVEKAALVFSLKLDNGHKSQCLWRDNACDEALAQFPPLPYPALVEQFKERSSLLVQLFSLPIISSSAIDVMSSPQLDQFLQESSAHISLTKIHRNGSDVESATLYYQVLNLISLCGWEPRLLSYVVDCKDQSDQIVKDANILSELPDRGNSIISVSVGGSSDGREGDSNHFDSSEALVDPKSVVLDCNLCGASVGLWPFFTVPRPLELFRLVGDTAVDDERNSGSQNTVTGNHVDGISTIPLNVPTLNFSIAGGPPPTRQNFKASISFPVVGRTIRARFSSDFDLRKHILVNQDNDQGQSISTPALQSRQGDNILRDTSENGTAIQGICSDRTNDRLEEGSSQDVDVQGFTENNNIAEESEDLGLTSSDVNTPHVKGSSDSINEQNMSGMLIEYQEGLSGENQASGPALLCNDVAIREPESSSAAQNALASEVSAADKSNVGEMQQTSSKDNLLGANSVKHTNLLSVDKGMEFDPIRQHRHFCPWITSTSGGVPGWQQVLSALQRQKEVSHSSPTSPPASSLIKVDDPVTSVRRLFTSKRMRPT